MEGWAKLHRKLLYSPIFYSEKLLKVFIWCLLKATHVEHEQLVGRTLVLLRPGQFIYGRFQAAMDLNMKESTVRDLINLLKKKRSITVKPTNKFSIITVENWGVYQLVNEKSTSKKTTKGQQKDTNNNVKNVKNNNPYTEQFEQFFQMFPLKSEKKKAFNNWKALIKQGYAEAQLLLAAKNYLTIQKRNDTEAKYIKRPGNFIGKDHPFLDYIDPGIVTINTSSYNIEYVEQSDEYKEFLKLRGDTTAK